MSDKLDVMLTILEGIDYSGLPASLRAGMERYVLYGIKPGDFLCGVLTNKLVKAVKNADYENRYKLLEIVDWCIEHLPKPAWGDELSVDSWMRKREEVRVGIFSLPKEVTYE
jgi:hypothetical protein